MLKRLRNLIWRLAQSFGLGRVLGLSLLVAFVAFRVWDPQPLQTLRLKAFDFYQVMSPRVKKALPVVIVDIDEESLSEIGQWPWARTTLADLVNRITGAGGGIVAFDIIFAEPDRLSPGAVVEAFTGVDEEVKAQLRALPSNDTILAEAFKQSRVVVGQSGFHRKLQLSDEVKAPNLPFGAKGGDPKPNLPTFSGLLRNIHELENSALGRGLITIRPDSDGIVRRVPTVMIAQDKVLPSLTVEMLRVATGSGPLLFTSNEAGIVSVALPGLEIPTDRNGQFWVHFTPHDPERYIPAKDVLNGTVDPSRLAGKLVLVGTSAIGLHDIKSTPIDPVMPGVEVHAQVLETILTKSFLSRPAYAVGAEVILAILIGVLIVIILPVFTPWVVLVLGATIAVTLVMLSWNFYINKGLLIDVAYPMVSSFFIYWSMVFLNYFNEERQRRQIRGAFSQYISPALVEQLAQDPEKLVLGGATRETTVLFSDVRGFTAISELFKDDPEGLTTLMNRFLTPLSNSIIDRSGTIDKYMGDAIMAFWNAPLDDASHAVNACDAALDMLDRLAALNSELEEEALADGKPAVTLNAGIGINTGECVVGNMGSDLRFDYSVLGDSVNLASRLEGQTKAYGVQIIIGSTTAALVGDRFWVVEIDAIRVKGKTEPEVIYALVGGDEVAGDGQFRQLAGKIAGMLDLYRSRQWAKAAAAAADCSESAGAFGLRGICDVYAERITAYQKSPPPKDWDGVFTATSK